MIWRPLENMLRWLSGWPRQLKPDHLTHCQFTQVAPTNSRAKLSAQESCSYHHLTFISRFWWCKWFFFSKTTNYIFYVWLGGVSTRRICYQWDWEKGTVTNYSRFFLLRSGGAANNNFMIFLNGLRPTTNFFLIFPPGPGQLQSNFVICIAKKLFNDMFVK